MKLRFHPHCFTISALLSLCLFGCEPITVNGIGAGGSGSSGSSGGAGGSSGGAGGSSGGAGGSSGGAGGSSGGAGGSGATSGGPEFCRSTALGNNTPVTFHIRNTGATGLKVLDGSVCGAMSWSVTSPDGGRLPSEYDFMCDGSSEACPGICDGLGFALIPAGAETTLVWNGILSQDVKLEAAKECPAAESDSDGCTFRGCQRHLDAAPGSYTVEVYAFTDPGAEILKTVTFDYPEQTDIDVVFP
ncbi:hypothetical protein WME91_33675 [Sorangium sp. So ce269]